MGAFVPATIAGQPLFQAIDSTNPACHPGPCIDPGLLNPIGASGVLIVQRAGTVYLGIDDFVVGDNGGGFDVVITTSGDTVPEPGTLPLLAGGCLAVLVIQRRGLTAVSREVNIANQC